MIKVVFFGTPGYVVPIVDALSKEFKVVAVVTQPPRAVGREQLKQFSPVDNWAHKKNIPIFFEPAKIVELKIEADLGVLESYGDFVPKNVINYFKYGIINAHPSLLPQWRGACPVPAAIIFGSNITGVTVIKLDSQWDHGPIISKFKEEIRSNDTTETLRKRLFERSGQFLIDLIPSYTEGKILPKEQDHSKATFTHQIKKDEAFINPEFLKAALQGDSLKDEWKIRFIKDFSLQHSALSLERFIRAMADWPYAWTHVQLAESGKPKAKKRLKILKAHLEKSSSLKLVLDTVQLEGKNPVTWKQFQEAYPEAKF